MFPGAYFVCQRLLILDRCPRPKIDHWQELRSMTTGSTMRESKRFFGLLREGVGAEEVQSFSTGRVRDKNRLDLGGVKITVEKKIRCILVV